MRPLLSRRWETHKTVLRSWVRKVLRNVCVCHTCISPCWIWECALLRCSRAILDVQACRAAAASREVSKNAQPSDGILITAHLGISQSLTLLGACLRFQLSGFEVRVRCARDCCAVCDVSDVLTDFTVDTERVSYLVYILTQRTSCWR